MITKRINPLLIIKTLKYHFYSHFSPFPGHDAGLEAEEGKQPGNQDEKLERAHEELHQESTPEFQGRHRHRNEGGDDEPRQVPNADRGRPLRRAWPEGRTLAAALTASAKNLHSY